MSSIEPKQIKAIFLDNGINTPTISNRNIKLYSAINSGSEVNKIELDGEKSKQITQHIWKEIINFYNTNQSNFEKYKTNNGLNLWFFINFRLYFFLCEFHSRIAIIEHFLSMHPNGEIQTSDTSLKDHFIYADINIIPKQRPIVSSLGKAERALKEIISILKSPRPKRKHISSTLIISDVRDHINGRNKRFHPLMKNYSILGFTEIFNLKNRLVEIDSLFKENPNIYWIIKKYLISIRFIKDQILFTQEIKVLLSSLNKSTNLDEQIYKFIKHHKSSFRVYHLIYKGFLTYFKSQNIANILLSGENNTQSRSIVQAAMDSNINTFGFQHGNIGNLSPAYIFGDYQGNIPLPTVTFLWGSYFKKLLLTKGGYSKNQVKTTGRIPTYTPRTLNSKIDRNKKVILFATQPIPNKAFRDKILYDVFKIAQTLQHTHQLIIRPHPNENKDQYFINISNTLEYSDYVIDRVSDLQSHFECCHYLITSYSTVGVEFISYFKPLLVLDYLKEDLIGYIKEGVGIPIYNQEDLLNALSSDITVNTSKSLDFLNKYYISNEDVSKLIERTIDEYPEA